MRKRLALLRSRRASGWTPTGRPLRARLLAPPVAPAALAAALILLGGLIWFRPYLTTPRGAVADVPAPSAMFAVTEFPVPPHEQACMQSVAVEPDSRIAEFQLRPARLTPGGGPPVELVLSAPGYEGVVHVPGGYPGGGVTLPLNPPTHSIIGTACFINRGKSTVLLDGTTEPRTVSRSSTSINGKTVVGDIALTFLDNRQRSLLAQLGEVFGHVSVLTDHLLPVWLIWLLAVLVALGVPAATIAALYVALREDVPAAVG
jgi:hypothetical protein